MTLIIDLNAAVSIVNIGQKDNPRYTFMNRTRLTGDMAGEIQGRITNNKNLPIAYCILGKDTVTSGAARGNQGTFRLRFLPKGIYSVSISDSIGSSYTTSVPLAEGQKVDLGDITLR